MNSSRSPVPFLAAWVAVAALFAGCTTETHNTLPTVSVDSPATAPAGPVKPLALGRFDNRSTYMRGMFTDGPDRLGSQARTILQTHLAQSGRFRVLDRGNLDILDEEAKRSGQPNAIVGATVIVTGEVTEFGRKETGDRALFGILGRGRKQTAYAKVALNVVDVKTSTVVHSVMGAGEYHLGNREVLGTGGVAGYDATLNGKVLDLAIRDCVNKLVAGMDRGEWVP